MSAPKLFISYSWSSPEHEQWVVDLAAELRESGVDVILDKWDLKEGKHRDTSPINYHSAFWVGLHHNTGSVPVFSADRRKRRLI